MSYSNPAFQRVTSNEVQVCPHCSEPTYEQFSGDEGFTCCPDCGIIEGEKAVYKYECPFCKELHDEDVECSCQEDQYERNEMDND